MAPLSIPAPFEGREVATLGEDEGTGAILNCLLDKLAIVSSSNVDEVGVAEDARDGGVIGTASAELIESS
jgi:hypothetical protein